MIILTAVASHAHCHFKPPFGKQDESFVSPERNLTWKELLAYGSSIRFTVRSLLVEVKKNSRLDFFDWKLRSVLATRLHISNHLALGVYDPYLLKTPPWFKQAPTLAVTLLWTTESAPTPLKIPIQFHKHFPIPYTATLLLIPSIVTLLFTCFMAVFALTPISFVFFVFTCIYIYIYIILCK